MTHSFCENLFNKWGEVNRNNPILCTTIDFDTNHIISKMALGPPPMFYESSSNDKHFHGNIIFVSTPAMRPTDSYGNYEGIYYYDTDISKSKWNLFCKYPPFLKLKNHNMCIDQEKKLLHVFGGDFNSFAILNLATKRWNVKVLSSDGSRTKANRHNTFEMENAVSIYLPSPISEMHIICCEDHVKYHEGLEKFMDRAEIPYGNLMHNAHYQIIYSENMNKLFLFGAGGKEEIYFCEIKTKNQARFIWKKFDVELPANKGVSYYIVQGWDHMVFIFYWNKCKDVYCIDLARKKIYKSDTKTPKFMIKSDRGSYLMSTKDNKAHFLSVSLYSNSYTGHYEFDLCNVIARGMIRDSFDHPLIMGYSRQIEKDINMFTIIPYYVAEIIWKYFPGIFNDLD